ncbi:hypothetical protein, variant [Aphanomyces invadans]|uniref:Uncharacterized protein n=1 Tax=Aphanomyces invadans TaxID=157072 RepID=A0A024TZQ4_9STRA|nr:hypothetical protein H310_08122 [Aphanomyces invadans]XP_008871986.1 hypothetical protein, variant [Aphanomyces invadans]ETV99429.1 hypothetical protein H310_08122 [Aphanomyces invadans]ETV99430.1 hypothetical protein, variant [Aphanomyces invadans]|eukprot:XP_008871985.1 hypothetical protein H310_08122 [Aphanomyces invadans]
MRPFWTCTRGWDPAEPTRSKSGRIWLPSFLVPSWYRMVLTVTTALCPATVLSLYRSTSTSGRGHLVKERHSRSRDSTIVGTCYKRCERTMRHDATNRHVAATNLRDVLYRRDDGQWKDSAVSGGASL